jgi:hypothetical protein
MTLFLLREIPAKDNVHPAGTFLGEGNPINGFDSGHRAGGLNKANKAQIAKDCSEQFYTDLY